MRMTYLILPGTLSRAIQRWLKSANLSLPPNITSRTDVLSVRSLHSSRITTPWGEPSNSWTLESTLQHPRVPSWIWIRRLNSASDNLAISVLDNLFWRPLFLIPKFTGLPTTGNTPKACSTLFLPVFLDSTTFSTKTFFQLNPALNFWLKNFSIFVRLFYFSF